MTSRDVDSASSRPLRVLVPLWVAATLLANAACLTAFASTPQRSFHLLTATLLALAFSQTSLAAIWAGLGSGLLLLRLAAPVVVALAWLGMLSLVGPSAVELMALIGLQILCVAGPLLLARAVGIRLMRVDRTLPDHHPLQFGIAHIMAWTTVVAVLLGLARVIPFPSDVVFRELILGPLFATVALLAVWAALGTSHVVPRLLVVLIVGPLLGLGACALLTPPQAPERHPFEFAAMTGLQGVLLAGSLWIVRLGGYRLTRKDSINWPDSLSPLQ